MEKRLLRLFLAAISSVTFYNFGFCAEQNFVVSDQSLNFGHDGTEKSIYLTNTNPNSDLIWSAQTNVPWLKLEQVQGQIDNPSRIPANVAYTYSNMWPKLPQPWYFSDPKSVGVDHEGNIYIVDYGQYSLGSIKKFNKYGEFLFEIRFNSSDWTTQWLHEPKHIAIDSQNNIYVTTHFWVVKFDKDGKLLVKFKAIFSGSETENIFPWDIFIDSQDNKYVTTSSCVLKFDKNDLHVMTIQGGSADDPLKDGEFWDDLGVVADSKGNIYVADNHYHRIQKFDSAGNFKKMWGFSTTEPRKLVYDWQLGEAFAIDSKDIIYIAHEHSDYLGKFDTEGNPIPVEWEYPFNSWGNNYLGDIVVTGDGSIYGCSPYKSVYKLDSQGKLLSDWKSGGLQWWLDPMGFPENSLYGPMALAVDKNGNIYVSAGANHIQIFSPEGRLTTTWDLNSKNYPSEIKGYYSKAIAVDAVGNVYIDRTYSTLNSYTSFIIKLDPQGNLVPNWKIQNLDNLTGLTVDSKGYIYLSLNKFSDNFVFKYSPDGVQLKAWGKDLVKSLVTEDNLSTASTNGMFLDNKGNICVNFQYYGGIAYKRTLFIFDSEGNLINQVKDVPYSPFAVDSGNNFYFFSPNGPIQKTDSSGNLLSSWGQVGIKEGSFFNNLNTAIGQSIVIGPQGNVYVLDTGNNRIQYFSQAAQAVKVTVDRTKLYSSTNTGKITFTNSRNAAETVSVDVTALTEITNTYGQWKALKFTPQQQNDPAVSAESADPDNDGIPNILEYAFNLDPLTFNPGKGYQYYLLNNRLTFKFQKNKAAQDITMQVGAKNGLFSSWDYNAMAYTYQDIDASTQIVTATDNTLSTSVPPGTVRLFKLQVTKNGAVASIMSLAAKPTAEYYTLTVNINGAGTVSSLSGKIKSGSRCTVQGLKGTSEILIATPAQGYKFNGWSGSYSGTSSKCVVAYTAQKQICASFSPKLAFVAPVKNVAVHQKTGSVVK